jgi:hypothetical protein
MKLTASQVQAFKLAHGTRLEHCAEATVPDATVPRIWSDPTSPWLRFHVHSVLSSLIERPVRTTVLLARNTGTALSTHDGCSPQALCLTGWSRSEGY